MQNEFQRPLTEWLAEVHQLAAPTSTPEELKKLMAQCAQMTELQLAKFTAKLAEANTQREMTWFQLLKHGLKNSSTNRIILEKRLGYFFTLKDAYDLITADQALRQSLDWDNEPFKEVHKAEAEEAAQDKKNYQTFKIAVQAAVRGGKSVAGSISNYKMLKDDLFENAKDFTTKNILELIYSNALNLAPENPTVVADAVAERDNEEKDRLCEIVADASQSWLAYNQYNALVRNDYARNRELKRLKQVHSVQELRDKVAVIEANRKLADEQREQEQQPKQEQRRTPQQQPEKPELPERIGGQAITSQFLMRLRNADKSRWQWFLKTYGLDQITRRIYPGVAFKA